MDLSVCIDVAPIEFIGPLRANLEKKLVFRDKAAKLNISLTFLAYKAALTTVRRLFQNDLKLALTVCKILLDLV